MDEDIASISLDTGGARDEQTTTDGEDVRAEADAAVDDATASHQAAEGLDSPADEASSLNGLKQALLSTGPDTPLAQVESPYDPDAGGITRMYRGMQKALDFDGTPAVVDLVIGAVEAFQNFEPAGGESDGQAAGAGAGGGLEEEGLGTEL